MDDVVDMKTEPLVSSPESLNGFHWSFLELHYYPFSKESILSDVFEYVWVDELYCSIVFILARFSRSQDNFSHTNAFGTPASL